MAIMRGGGDYENDNDDENNDDEDDDNDDEDDDGDDVTDHHTGSDAVHIEKIEPVVNEAVSVPLKIKILLLFRILIMVTFNIIFSVPLKIIIFFY